MTGDKLAHLWSEVDCRIGVLFSTMKKKRMLFGEYICVMARNYRRNMVKMFLKASLYNMFVGIKL
ncbi:MAG TPA: hypothetical protein VNI77_09895 [Nitrososphaera sp.]|nr:hypothetical protein [Nitrososphaera sp.]